VIRGSIEVAQRKRVAGWIFCSAASVRESEVLAFIGARCVGAGRVDRFRQDLYEAGLGDGYCGFDFPLNLADDDKLGGVVVRLAGSDASLIQAGTRLLGPQDDIEASDAIDLGALAPATVAWMHDRGMLEQHEYDFLRAVQALGAYERGLRPARRPGAEIQPPAKPEQVVQALLGLYAMTDVIVASQRAATLSDLAGADSPLRAGELSVAAIWSEERGRITLDERSHLGAPDGRGQVLAQPPLGGIDYNYGPDRLLFLHRECSFAPASHSPVSGLLVFTASLRAASQTASRTRAA